MSPKVSVAIPSYNQKEFLREAIESVLGQGYDNLEIVVSDDASTDGTQEMLREYDKKHPGKFRMIFQKKNLGITGNNNSAFFGCSGKYLAWLDGDDMMLPGKIKKQVALMESNPNCVVCCHNIEVFDSESNKLLKYYYDPKLPFPIEGRFEKIIQYGGFIGRPSQMFRRSACPKYGFETRLSRAPDWLFLIETGMKGEIKYIPEALSRYRKHEANVTKKTGSDLSYKLTTLAILETKYPHLWKYTRLCRARFLYKMGVQKVLGRQGKEARLFLIESMRQGWVSWKWFGWFLNSWLGLKVGR
jgi:glycosyltransferase involved in cell wall biosynthesis